MKQKVSQENVSINWFQKYFCGNCAFQPVFLCMFLFFFLLFTLSFSFCDCGDDSGTLVTVWHVLSFCSIVNRGHCKCIQGVICFSPIILSQMLSNHLTSYVSWWIYCKRIIHLKLKINYVGYGLWNASVAKIKPSWVDVTC